MGCLTLVRDFCIPFPLSQGFKKSVSPRNLIMSGNYKKKALKDVFLKTISRKYKVINTSCLKRLFMLCCFFIKM